MTALHQNPEFFKGFNRTAKAIEQTVQENAVGQMAEAIGTTQVERLQESLEATQRKQLAEIGNLTIEPGFEEFSQNIEAIMATHMANQLRPEICYPTSAVESLRETAQYSLLQDDAFWRVIDQPSEAIRNSLKTIQFTTAYPAPETAVRNPPPATSTVSTNTGLPAWLAAGQAKLIYDITIATVERLDDQIEWDKATREFALFIIAWGTIVMIDGKPPTEVDLLRVFGAHGWLQIWSSLKK